MCLAPGPAVLYVISSGLRAGARRSMFSNAGILAANAVYFALSATGVGALLVANYNLFLAIKWIGAAYLIFIGARALFGKASLVESTDEVRGAISGWKPVPRRIYFAGVQSKSDRVFLRAAAAIYRSPTEHRHTGGDSVDHLELHRVFRAARIRHGGRPRIGAGARSALCGLDRSNRGWAADLRGRWSGGAPQNVELE